MFITAVCFIFLIKLRWPKTKSLYDTIEAFNKILKDKKSLRVNITEKKKALNKRVKSFRVSIIDGKDPVKQLYYTTPDVAKELEGILHRDGGMPFQLKYLRNTMMII